MLLSVLLGSGVQVFFMTLVTLGKALSLIRFIRLNLRLLYSRLIKD